MRWLADENRGTRAQLTPSTPGRQSFSSPKYALSLLVPAGHGSLLLTLQERQIVQRLENLLLAVPATLMLHHHLLAMTKCHPFSISLRHDLMVGIFHRNRVVILVKTHQRFGVSRRLQYTLSKNGNLFRMAMRVLALICFATSLTESFGGIDNNKYT